MRLILVAAACALAVLGPVSTLARCAAYGVASAPFIGPADIKAIDRAVVTLPAVRRGQVQLSVGAVLPRDIETKPVPLSVKKVLPQYAGYLAFRTGHDLIVVKPGSRHIAYILPLRGSASDRCS